MSAEHSRLTQAKRRPAAERASDSADEAQPNSPADWADAEPELDAEPTEALDLPYDDRWRQTHLGRLLGHAMRRFDERVLLLMANSAEAPLALSNLALRDKVGAAHVHITRHLPLEGARTTELAQWAGMSKQAMADLVDQCEAWGLVTREPDPRDARAKRVRFTELGMDWLRAFQQAVAQAEAEFRAAVGTDVATVVALGLEAYAFGED